VSSVANAGTQTEYVSTPENLTLKEKIFHLWKEEELKLGREQEKENPHTLKCVCVSSEGL
jgi:hypothetical protein